eukprot:3534511-Prymnesium_polylepis.7
MVAQEQDGSADLDAVVQHGALFQQPLCKPTQGRTGVILQYAMSGSRGCGAVSGHRMRCCIKIVTTERRGVQRGAERIRGHG